MQKIYWEDKKGRFTWTDCPKCGRFVIIAKNPIHELTPEDGNCMTRLSEALFFPKKFDHFEKGNCLKGRHWHICFRETNE